MSGTELLAALRGYLASRARVTGAFVLLLAVQAAVLLLAHLPAGIVGYGSLLAACIGALLLIPGFFPYWRAHAALRAAIRRSGAGLEQLPPPGDLIARDYGELLRLIERERRRQADELHRRAEETARYYTMWAHQIKTPLAAMRLLAQEEAAAGGEYLAELFKVEQYVAMALEYQHLDGGVHDLVLARVELGDAVRSAVRRVSTLFIHKKLSLELGELSGSAVTDEKWLVFVLEQLLTNAVKYTPRGTVRVTASGGVIEITDSGIGIRPEELPRIFDWGYTGRNGRTDERSTGVGLYLCRRVLDMLGHGIEIESEPGKGTRVRLDLRREELMIE